MRRVTPLVAVATFAILMSVSGCSSSDHDPERYVLTGNDANLFYKKQLMIAPEKADRIIEAVRKFSDEHNMDFLLARESLPPGDFNTSANGPTLNIAAMHTSAVGDEGVQVFAIAKGTPTPEDKAMVAEFVARLENAR